MIYSCQYALFVHLVFNLWQRRPSPKKQRYMLKWFFLKDCNVIRVSEIQKVLDIADERSLIDTIFFCYLGCNARFLQENPEYVAQGVTLAQFSFQIPIPLRQDYVKKKPKLINASDEASTITSKSSEPDEVNPIAWAVPTKHEGDASEEASLADETLASEVVLTRKRKIGSSLSVEPNHLSDELEPKLEDA
ncbi:Serine/arginine-rich splicing factor SR45a [Zea mays]|uniref:Serine/arginine-rich splicing factor SR45a n=1 Tax=Zea mays TaxID=4577 RepID=A0A1D6MGH3_MAIZE|nr:Serine/arginine-rich splicing factor SR45a [Zea mays]ONM28640.1 Serine/arginine-rich splicing factor SR45a [Zea mays]ONM28684.1 Serine/arginine-rich splicing factor SR45a [Zea mays]